MVSMWDKPFLLFFSFRAQNARTAVKSIMPPGGKNFPLSLIGYEHGPEMPGIVYKQE